MPSMTPHGGRRQGAGRKPRQEPKSYPIWCGQMSEADRALILETLAPQERFDALMSAAERERTMDRNAQIDELRNIAANIAFSSDDPTTSAQDRVDYYCTEFADELPEWFDDHDKMLLVRFVEE